MKVDPGHNEALETLAAIRARYRDPELTYEAIARVCGCTEPEVHRACRGAYASGRVLKAIEAWVDKVKVRYPL